MVKIVRRATALLGLLVGLSAAAAWAADYGVGPGADFATAEAAFASGRLAGGDRLLLTSGGHGPLTIRDQHFSPPLVITSAPGGRARVDRINIRASDGITVTELEVWPTDPVNIEKGPGDFLVKGWPDARRIRFERLDIRAGPDAANYMTWSRDDWLHKWRMAGVGLGGPDQMLLDSTLTAVSNGIGTTGARAQVIGNQINGFSRDAMRGFGDGSVFRGNLVRDCFKVDGNHDDAFQSWADRPDMGNRRVLRDITLEDNTILEWTGPADHPLKGVLQGIALFRGLYDGWVIRNNVIAVSAAHGIALYGAQRSQIINNTVVHPEGKSGKAPWITLIDIKNVPSLNNVVANNTAMRINVNPQQAVLAGNMVTRDPAKVYENLAAHDFRPKPGSGLAGRADPRWATPRDLAGRDRKPPSIGALEPH